jgi:mercuric ion transport protein
MANLGLSMDTDQPNQHSVLSWLTLFASTGTLLCCALPILLVSLGLGAVVASLTSSWPVLITLAEYEPWMFTVSGILLALTAWVLWFRAQQCPSDPVLAQHCEQARTWNRRVFWVAVIVWCVGFTAAFLLLPIRNMLGI